MRHLKEIFEDIIKEPAVKSHTEEKEGKAPKQEAPKVGKHTFRVEGIIHHLSEIQEHLLGENSDYLLGRKAMVDIGLIDTMVYRYDGYSNNVDFVPEPDHPHNPDAMKVMVDGIFIGYVPDQEIDMVKNLLDKDGLQTECSFVGGEYKIIHNEGNYYRLKTGKEDIGAIVRISYKV